MMPLLMVAYLFSCQKSNDLTKKTTIPGKDEPNLSHKGDEGITTRSSVEFDYSLCPAIKSSVYKSGDKLVFQDLAHLENCAICLEQDYDTYNDQYDAQYPNATAEELDALDEINNFNELAPYIAFEQGLGFSSLRAKVENEVNLWLSSTPADQINFENDPDDQVPIDDDATRALFNENGLVILGSAVKSMQDFENGTVFNNPLMLFGCSFWKKRRLTFDFNNDPILVDRQLKVMIAVRSGIVSSKLRGRVRHFKKVDGNYKLRRAKLKIGAEGDTFDVRCSQTPQYWYKYKGYKNRRRLTATSHITQLWREAITDRNDPRYLGNYCVANAYYLSDVNYYRVLLD